MRERRGTGAVSITLSTLLFLIVGGVIAVCSMLAGMETSLVATNLIIYAFIAGPIFLAGALSHFEPSKHRSFRATLSYMEGKRIKPRLQLIRCIISMLALSAMLSAVFGTFALACTERVPERLFFILLCGSAVAAYFLTIVVSKWFFVWRGWMTPDEARVILSRLDRLPDSCLEPAAEGKPATRDVVVRRTYLAALVAMLVAAAAVIAFSRSRLLPGGAIVKWLLLFGAAASAYFVVVFALKRLYVQLGIVSREEARLFPSWSCQCPKHRLESTDNDDAAKSADQMSEKTPERETRE